MRIGGFTVEGFGVFSDWRVEDLPGGLVVFYGPNESGKSTLLAFLRCVLFGFPHGNSREPRYPPLAGGRHGGVVFLHSDAGSGDGAIGSNTESGSGTDGRIATVERIAGPGGKLTITLADGSEGSAADLASMTGHADGKLFKSVFAFSLNELQTLESLSDEGIQSRIFSAGITGAGRSAREAVARLDAVTAKLYRRGRGTSRAREIAEKLSVLEGELAKAREAMRGHAGIAEQEHALGSEIAALRQRADVERRAYERAQKLLELWNEVQSPLEHARRECAALAVPEHFPANPDGRLERLLERLLANAAEATSIESRSDSAHRQTRDESNPGMFISSAGMLFSSPYFGSDSISLPSVLPWPAERWRKPRSNPRLQT